MDWKRSLLKSIIYRIIALILGLIVALAISGDIFTAGLISLLTESIQFCNYFIFETIWSSYENKRLRKEIEEEFLKREIDLKIDYDSINELSYELSRTNTFVNEIYTSILNFFGKMLKNEQIEKLHEEISKHKAYFESVHVGRNFK